MKKIFFLAFFFLIFSSAYAIGQPTVVFSNPAANPYPYAPTRFSSSGLAVPYTSGSGVFGVGISTDDGLNWSDLNFASSVTSTGLVVSDLNILFSAYQASDGYFHYRWCLIAANCQNIANWTSDINFGVRGDINASELNSKIMADFNSSRTLHMIVPDSNSGTTLTDYIHFYISYLDSNLSNPLAWKKIGKVNVELPNGSNVPDMRACGNLLYFSYAASESNALYLAEFNESTETWSRDILVDTGGPTIIGSVDVNSNCYAKIVYTDGSTTKYSSYKSGFFSDSVLVPFIPVGRFSIVSEPLSDNMVFLLEIDDTSEGGTGADVKYAVLDDATQLLSPLIDINVENGFQGVPTVARKQIAFPGNGFNKVDFVYAQRTNVPKSVLYDYLPFAPIERIDVNLLTPNGNQYISTVNGNQDGNQSIDFNITSDVNTLHLRAYVSTTRFGFQNLLFDYNLEKIGGIPTGDLNCGAASIDFNTVRVCHLDWNVLNPVYLGDGNYFIDLNVNDYNLSNDLNIIVSSASSFQIDTNKPSVLWDGNVGVWQKTDSNIHLVYSDASPSSLVLYRVDQDRTSGVSMGAWQTYDQNIFFTGDGNYALDFNSTDVAGNIGDTNRQYVLIDNNAPYLVNSVPSSDTTWTTTTFPFAWSVVDGNGSYAKQCDFNAYVDGLIIPIYTNATGTMSSDGKTCSANVSYNTAHNQVVTTKARVIDYVDYNSNTATSFSYTFNLFSGGGGTPGGGGGGGGGGGSVGPPEIPSVNGQYLKINCVYGSLEVSYFERTKFFCEIKNLKEKDLNIAVDFDNEAAKYLEQIPAVIFIPATQTIQLTFQTKLTDLNNTLNSKFAIRGFDAYGIDKQEFKVTFIPKVIPSNPLEAIAQQLNKDLGGGFRVWYLIVIFAVVLIVAWKFG